MSDTTQQVIYIKVTDALPVNRGVYTTNKGELRAVFGDNEFLYWTDLKHKKHIHSKKGVEWYLQPIDANSVKQEAAAKAWISVEDRLPEKSCFVICQKHNGLVLGLFYSAYKEFLHGTDDQTSQITHWMPMPEPIKTS